MKKLEFQNVIQSFDDNFMKRLPNIIPVFIEVEKDKYCYFKDKLDGFYSRLKNKQLTLEEKLEIKILIKEIYKAVSQFVINVKKEEAEILPPFYIESEMKVCSFDQTKNFYFNDTGWKTTSSLSF